MRYSLIFCIAFGIFLTGCSKDDSPSPQTAPVEQASALPASFTQKVLLELFTTAKCPTCPEAMDIYRKYSVQYPTRVYAAALHDIDGMEINQFESVDSMLNITQYSSGSFNRLPWNNKSVIHKSDWNASNLMNTSLNKTAGCGIKLKTSISQNTLNVEITSGFIKDYSGKLRLTVYVLEDSITGSGPEFDQQNYYNNQSNSPFYQLGDPIVNYKHNHVVRKVMTSASGSVLNTDSYITTGTVITKNYSCNISPYNKNRLSVIAFIHKTGNTATAHEIYNVQKIKAGDTGNWN